jgi:hypothetical protein
MMSMFAPLDKYDIHIRSISVRVSVKRVIHGFWSIRRYSQISMDNKFFKKNVILVKNNYFNYFKFVYLLSKETRKILLSHNNIHTFYFQFNNKSRHIYFSSFHQNIIIHTFLFRKNFIHFISNQNRIHHKILKNENGSYIYIYIFDN